MWFIDFLLKWEWLFDVSLQTRGAAVSMVLASAASPLLLLGYIWLRRLHRQTWGGWSWESLRGWGQFARFAFPGLMMVVFEWCSIEISTFVAGSISQTQLGISSVVANLLNVIYMVRHCGGVGMVCVLSRWYSYGNQLSSR